MTERTLTKTVEPPTTSGPAVRIERGRVLGRYEILAPLGSGGMAEVWLCRASGQGGFTRLMALKTPRAGALEEPRLRAMFLREAEIAAAIRHANVVDVLDVGEADGVLYQAMALVEGETLGGLLRDAGRPLGVAATISIVVDALRGLHAAHECTDGRGASRQLVHRDVSPQNILVGLDGAARVSDFGIAAVLSEADDETTGTLRGKYAYFSPEQARREPLDRRSDVFAMGVVLWEALTGERLFKGRDAVDTIERVKNALVTSPSVREPGVPPAIADVVMRALDRDRTARYPTAEAMADALVDAARGAGLQPDRREVAKLVDTLVGERVRSVVRRAVSGETAHREPLPSVPASVLTASRPGEPRPRPRFAAAVAVATILVATGGVFVWRSRAQAPVATSAPPPSPTPSAGAEPPRAPAVPADVASATTPAGAASPPAAAASAAARSTSPSRRGVGPSPSAVAPRAPASASAAASAAPLPRPPFEDNPFATPTPSP